MSIPVAVGVILGSLLLFVIVTMLLEQRGQVVQRIQLAEPARSTTAISAPVPLVAAEPVAAEPVATEPVAPKPVAPEPVAPEPVAAEPVAPEPVAARVAAPVAAHVQEAPTSMAPAAGLGWGVLRTGPSSISLRNSDVVDTMSGVLFAAYVAGGGAAAKRVSGWVSVRTTPPSLDADAFPPGADMRGKLGRVATILDCDDLGATWVVLQPRVDIARGLVRSPVTDPVLAGLLVWWRASRSLPTVLGVEEATDLASSIAAIEDRLAGHPWERAVSELRTALLDGVVNDREVLLGVADRDARQSPGTEPTPRDVNRKPEPATRPTALHS
ncbi:MAG: hypothetical protein ACKO5A_07775 [Actinomycetota bacterium]